MGDKFEIEGGGEVLKKKWNHWNLFGVHQNGTFYQDKAFYAGKKSEKVTLPPLKKILLCHWQRTSTSSFKQEWTYLQCIYIT